MDQLLLKNYEILNNIKNEYDKLLEENKLLKEQLNKNETPINSISPNNIKPINNNIHPDNVSNINTKQEETIIINDLIKKYPLLTKYQNANKSRLYIWEKDQEDILKIITDESDKTMYIYYYGLVRNRKNKISDK